jgi:glycosyltransferase involved in cell wall biosynthesis
MKQKTVTKHKPLVSVIIPVFNGASYLVEAVDSVQKSTFRNFEIILVDDGSTDQSVMLCKILSEKYKNLRFFSFKNNKGLGRVLNFALKKAEGKYICRLNQDDHMLPNRMAKQIEFFAENPEVVAVGSWITYFEDNGNREVLKFLKTDKEIKEIWHIVSPFSDPSVMYHKQTALNVGGYDQSFWPVDDTHLWYRMGLAGKLANIQEPLVEVRWHAKAGSVFFFREMAWQIYRVRRWAHKNIQKGSIALQIFWILQLAAGMTLSPNVNWKVYRFIKKIIAWYENKKYHTHRKIKNIRFTLSLTK